MLDWKLCNLNGAVLQGGRLDDRKPGGKVDITQHDLRRASVPLDIDDPAGWLAYPLYTVLKVAMDDYPLFTGYVIKPRFDLQQGTVEINAVDPGYRLQYLFTGMRADGAGLPNAVSGTNWRWTETYSAMLYYLLEHVSPTAAETASGVKGHGIYHELVAQGPSRTRDYNPGAQAWSIFQDATTVDDPIEWEFVPVDALNGTLVNLVTYYPRQGSDKSGNVVFHIGWGIQNAFNLLYEPDGGPVINRSMRTGQTIEGEPVKFARADQPESQKAFGQYMDYQGQPDILDSAALAEFAQGAVSTRGWPQDFFTLQLPTEDGSGYVRNASDGSWVKLPNQFGKPHSFGPSPNHKFWIGDTIRAIGKTASGQVVNVSGRIHTGSITEVDSAGNTQAEVQATPTVSEVGVTVVTG